jgi:hypothetical protein
VKVVGAGGAVAEVDDDRRVVAPELRRPREADGLRDLRADGRADGAEVRLARRVVIGHLPAARRVVGVAEHVVEIMLERKASP